MYLVLIQRGGNFIKLIQLYFYLCYYTLNSTPFYLDSKGFGMIIDNHGCQYYWWFSILGSKVDFCNSEYWI